MRLRDGSESVPEIHKLAERDSLCIFQELLIAMRYVFKKIKKQKK